MANRLRIGSLKNGTDYWHNFNNQLICGNMFDKRAKEVLENWKEVEKWWNENPNELNK